MADPLPLYRTPAARHPYHVTTHTALYDQADRLASDIAEARAAARRHPHMPPDALAHLQDAQQSAELARAGLGRAFMAVAAHEDREREYDEERGHG